MDKPKLYSVLWKNKSGELKIFETDCEDAALKIEVRRSGTTYIDTRYAGKMRLYRYMTEKQRCA